MDEHQIFDSTLLEPHKNLKVKVICFLFDAYFNLRRGRISSKRHACTPQHSLGALCGYPINAPLALLIHSRFHFLSGLRTILFSSVLLLFSSLLLPFFDYVIFLWYSSECLQISWLSQFSVALHEKHSPSWFKTQYKLITG